MSFAKISLERERGERSQKSAPAAAALAAILGHGVGPRDFAHRLAIEIEDGGAFRNRCERLEEFAELLALSADHLFAEARRRRRAGMVTFTALDEAASAVASVAGLPPALVTAARALICAHENEAGVAAAARAFGAEREAAGIAATGNGLAEAVAIVSALEQSGIQDPNA